MANPTDITSARASLRAFFGLVRHFATFAGPRGVLALIYIALGAVFESFGLLLLVPLLSLVIGVGSVPAPLRGAMVHLFGILGAGTTFAKLGWLMGGFSVLMVIRGVTITLRERTVLSLQIGFVENLRGEIATALASAGWDRVLRLRHARVLNVMGSDIQRISMASNYMVHSSVAVVVLAAQCVLSFVLSPLLALFSFALLAMGAAAMVPVLRRSRAMGQFVGGAQLALLDSTGRFLDGLKLAVSQSLQDGYVGEFQSALRDLTSRQLRFINRQQIGRNALTTVAALVGAIVFLVGYGVLGLSASVLLTFLVVIGRMSGPAAMIQQGFQQLALGLPAYESIIELLFELAPGKPPQTLANRRPLEGPVVFDAVTFQHPQADGELSHGVIGINFTLQPGSVLGIAGSSGAGKTTFADLLVGLLRPQSGQITVGGRALDEATLPAWRNALSYISQDPFLFHDTVRRNLLWARPEATEDDMWEALALTGADTIVRAMESGLDAVVGERGTLVSGGERQRIALARALLRKPRLLVMDEATNAIDVDGERTVLERVLATRPRPTIVIVAHRAETLALCDRVVCISQGRLHDDMGEAAALEDMALTQ